MYVMNFNQQTGASHAIPRSKSYLLEFSKYFSTKMKKNCKNTRNDKKDHQCSDTTPKCWLKPELWLTTGENSYYTLKIPTNREYYLQFRGVGRWCR